MSILASRSIVLACSFVCIISMSCRREHPPAPPSNLVANIISSTQIDLSWLDNSHNEDRFRIEKLEPLGLWTLVTIPPANTTNYSCTGLNRSSSYSFRIRAENDEGNSAFSNIVGSRTQADPPTLTAPATSTGTIPLRLEYVWGSIVSTGDMYEIEQSTTSATTGFSVVHTTPMGTHSTPYTITLTRPPGTYFFRARTYDNLIWTGYSNVIQVRVVVPPRTLTIVNNLSSTQSTNANKVVRIRVGANEDELLVAPDMLTPEPAQCVPVTVIQSIDRGENQSFAINIGSNYHLFIGLGSWDVDFNCPSSAPWFKKNWAPIGPNGAPRFMWVHILISNHTSGNFVWTILGSHTTGNLRIVAADGTSIPFNITSL